MNEHHFEAIVVFSLWIVLQPFTQCSPTARSTLDGAQATADWTELCGEAAVSDTREESSSSPGRGRPNRNVNMAAK